LLKPDFKAINPGMIYKDPDLHAYSLLVMNIEEIENRTKQTAI